MIYDLLDELEHGNFCQLVHVPANEKERCTSLTLSLLRSNLMEMHLWPNRPAVPNVQKSAVGLAREAMLATQPDDPSLMETCPAVLELQHFRWTHVDCTPLRKVMAELDLIMTTDIWPTDRETMLHIKANGSKYKYSLFRLQFVGRN